MNLLSYYLAHNVRYFVLTSDVNKRLWMNEWNIPCLCLCGARTVVNVCGFGCVQHRGLPYCDIPCYSVLFGPRVYHQGVGGCEFSPPPVTSMEHPVLVSKPSVCQSVPCLINVTVCAVAMDCIVFLRVFFSVRKITHKPLHLARWNLAWTRSLTTAWTLFYFKVIGQRSRSQDRIIGFFVVAR